MNSLTGAFAAAFLIVLCSAQAQTPSATPTPTPTPAPSPKSQVYFAMERSVFGPERAIKEDVVTLMVDNLLLNLTKKRTLNEAWLSLVKPTDKVGIKVAASAGSVSGTNPEVVDAVVTGLLDAGVPARNIIVWDRNMTDLIADGFRRDGKYYQLEAIDPSNGYDQNAMFSEPVLGKLIWGDHNFGNRKRTRSQDWLSGGDQLSSQSFYAKTLTSQVTKIINIPSLTDSFLTGVNGALANMTLPNVDNWRRFTKEPAFGDPYLAEIYADPVIHDKVVLTMLDGLILQYAGGPFGNPNFCVPYYAIFASFDPVAIDATAVQLVDEYRKAVKLPSVRPMAAWLDSASSMGLGNAASGQIEMTRVGTGLSH